MTDCIRFNHACSVGLMIIAEKVEAWATHDRARTSEVMRKEADHLAQCATCNPDLLITQLWQGVKVSE